MKHLEYFRIPRWLAAGVLMFALLGPAVCASDDVTLNFVEVDIESAIRTMGQMTGRSFVVDPRVKGSVTLVAKKPIKREAAYQMLVSALRLQGFAVVEGSGVVKVLPDADARTQGGPVASDSRRGDQIVTRVFELRYESAPQLATALRPLVGANQSIVASAASNALVVTDTADNLARLERIVSSLDVPHGDDPQVVKLQHASALEVAATISRLITASAQGGGLIASPDARTNKIVLRADNPALLVRAMRLIESLDSPEAGVGNIRVVYLQHVEAARLAQILRVIVAGESGGGSGAGGGGASAASQATASSVAGAAQAANGQSAAAAGRPGASKSAQPNATSGVSTTDALQAGSMIQADVTNNALIITAPDTVFINLQNVIAMLDRRRAQVNIEALIVEVSADRASEMGIQWQNLGGAANASGSHFFGGTNFGGSDRNIIAAAANLGKLGVGLNFGIASGAITLPGLGSITDLSLLASFLESQVDANILSTPSIMTLDNEEARIVIGQNLPFVTGSYSTTGSSNTVTPFQTYERRDVGLTLRVRPMITDGRVVRLQVYQEASSVQSGTAGNSAGPITNTRSIESSVLVDDGSILALGGLMEDTLGTDEEKVPVLGDLPGLRHLFRYEKRTRKKTNLMVFLRPTIVRGEADALAQATARYDQMQKIQRAQGDASLLPKDGQSVPLLPDAVPGTQGGLPAPGR